MLKENIEVKLKKDLELKMLNEEYSHYKSKNSLEEYFQKYLSDDTRKKTLKDIDDLLQQEDWMEELTAYRKKLDRLNYSNTNNELQLFHNELLEAQTGKLAICTEQVKFAEETIAENENQPPLPAATFNMELTKALSMNYNFGVHETGKRVTE